MGRRDGLATVARDIAVPQVVGHDDHKIRSGRWFRRLAGTIAAQLLEEGECYDREHR
jgi:hypothetical protein